MRKFLILFGATAVVLLGYFVSENYRTISPSSANSFELKLTGKEYLLLSLSSELESINASLPRQIDPHTILNYVAIDGETIINNHTIIGTPVSGLTPESITQTLIPQLVRQICNDGTKREFLENDIHFSMDYYDPEQALIFKAVITGADCK
jgi:hypothetical protein